MKSNSIKMTMVKRMDGLFFHPVGQYENDDPITCERWYGVCTAFIRQFTKSNKVNISVHTTNPKKKGCKRLVLESNGYGIGVYAFVRINGVGEKHHPCFEERKLLAKMGLKDGDSFYIRVYPVK